MDTSSILLLITDVLIVFLLALIKAVPLVPVRITGFELKRRLTEGDPEATLIQTKNSLLPRILALRHITELQVSIIIVLLSVAVFGLVLGTFIALAGLLLADTIRHRRILQDTARRYYGRYEDTLMGRARRWGWLDLIGGSESSSDEVALSSKAELLDVAVRSHGVLSRDEQQRLRSMLAFDDVVVRDIMTPSSVIESIDQHEVIGPLVLDQLHKTGHSRFPVTEGDIDHIVGMLYLHDLITLQSRYETAKDAMHPEVYYVREDYGLERVLHAFLRTHHHLFIVVNEFRETVGILSLEDVIESLLGRQVIDEFDEYHDLRKVAETNPRESNEPKGKIDL